MKSDTFRNDVLKLIFNATNIANIADNTATAPLTNLFVALHNADPGGAGTQSTSETAYTGYARATVARTTGGWTVTTNSVSPVAAIPFGACTAGTDTITCFSVGVAVSGATKILRRGYLGSRLGPFTAITTGNAFTIPGLTGLAVNDRIIFVAVDGSTLPGGVTAGTSYFVITVSGDNITVSTTQGGASITISASGDGLAYRSTPIAVTSGVTPQLGTGTVIVEE
jgi:hypothetical protein